MTGTVIIPKDMISFFSDKITLVDNYNNRIYRYVFKDYFGKGFMNRMIVNDYTEVWFSEYCFNKEVIILYDMPEDVFEMAYCLAGEMEHYLGDFDAKDRITTGQTVLFGRYNASGYAKYLKDTPYRGISIITSKDYVANRLKYAIGQLPAQLFDGEKIDQLSFSRDCEKDLRRLFEKIHSTSLEGAAKLLYLDGVASQCIAHTYDLIKPNYVEAQNQSLSAYDIENMRLAKDILISDLANPPSIVALAKAIGINATKLKQDFKSVHGNTIYRYLRDRRLSESKKMLLQLDMTIANIAVEVGYSNASKFAIAFKKRYGINPKYIRKSNKG